MNDNYITIYDNFMIDDNLIYLILSYLYDGECIGMMYMNRQFLNLIKNDIYWKKCRFFFSKYAMHNRSQFIINYINDNNLTWFDYIYKKEYLGKYIVQKYSNNKLADIFSYEKRYNTSNSKIPIVESYSDNEIVCSDGYMLVKYSEQNMNSQQNIDSKDIEFKRTLEIKNILNTRLQSHVIIDLANEMKSVNYDINREEVTLQNTFYKNESFLAQYFDTSNDEFVLIIWKNINNRACFKHRIKCNYKCRIKSFNYPYIVFYGKPSVPFNFFVNIFTIYHIENMEFINIKNDIYINGNSSKYWLITNRLYVDDDGVIVFNYNKSLYCIKLSYSKSDLTIEKIGFTKNKRLHFFPNNYIDEELIYDSTDILNNSSSDLYVIHHFKRNLFLYYHNNKWYIHSCKTDSKPQNISNIYIKDICLDKIKLNIRHDTMSEMYITDTNIVKIFNDHYNKKILINVL